MKLTNFLKHILYSTERHLKAKNLESYELVLKYIHNRKDIWKVSQGKYISWWRKREKSKFKIYVYGEQFFIYTSLENAVIEKYPGTYLTTPTIQCKNSKFNGELWITIDIAIPQKNILVEILKREGILNFKIDNKGDIFLSKHELEPFLSKIDLNIKRNKGIFLESDIKSIRSIIIKKLNEKNLPLLRIWYHPRINGKVMRAVFSPRYDVDRAITNLERIMKLERKYNIFSTIYIRAFCPFYDEIEIKRLTIKKCCSEIALHGEFVSNSLKYNSELKSAIMEKKNIENLTGKKINGICMHGGELQKNKTRYTDEIIKKIGFHYDTTPSMQYFFPTRKLIHGKLSFPYNLCHTLTDIKIPANHNYSRELYKKIINKMDEVYQKNGVFVLMMHPVYFGFFSYIFKPKNFLNLINFIFGYFSNILFKKKITPKSCKCA